MARAQKRTSKLSLIIKAAPFVYKGIRYLMNRRKKQK